MTEKTDVKSPSPMRLALIKVVRILFFTLIVLTCHYSVADTNSGQLQLFFLSKESSSKQNSSQDAATDGDVQINSQVRKTDVAMQASRAKWLWFNGLIRIGDRILLLINDLPCEYTAGKPIQRNTHSNIVICRHVNKEHYWIQLLTDKHALRVFKRSQYVATLYVGQSL